MKKIKNRGIIARWSNRNIIFLDIRRFNYDSIEDFRLLINFVNHLSNGKNIFVDSRGLEDGSIEHSYIKSKVPDLYRPWCVSLFLSEVSTDVIHQSIRDSDDTVFYFFKPTVIWEQLLKTNKIKEGKKKKKGYLAASFTIADAGSNIFITTRMDYSGSVADLLEAFAQRGYKIKNSILKHVLM
jgi:hypothetical protein